MNTIRLKTVLIVALFFAFATSFAQTTVNQVIWAKDRPLQWTDFKKAPNNNAIPDAWPWITEFYKYQGSKDQDGNYNFTFETYSAMRPDSSWVKAFGQSDRLLHHEQIRFDISEFFARQLLVALKAFKYTDNYEEETRQVYQIMAQERNAILMAYDDQTEHSRNYRFQKKWDIYIADLLNSNYTLEQALAKQPKKDY